MTIQLDDYKTFASKEEMNEAIRRHLREHRYKLNKTEVKTLETVSRYAVKYPGAAWLKIETLARIVEKSPTTVRRALAKLEALQIVERVAYLRPKRGGNGGNILRILPFNEKPNDCPPMDGRKESPEEAQKPAGQGIETKEHRIETICPNKRKSYLKYTVDTANAGDKAKAAKPSESLAERLRRGLMAKLPQAMAHSLAPFFDEAGLYRAYGVVLRAKASICRDIEIEAHEDAYRDAVLSVMQAYKRGKVRDVYAVLYEAIRRTTKSLHIRRMFSEAMSL